MAVISHSESGYAPCIYSLNSWHMVRVLGVEAAELNFKREGRPGSEQAQYLED